MRCGQRADKISHPADAGHHAHDPHGGKDDHHFMAREHRLGRDSGDDHVDHDPEEESQDEGDGKTGFDHRSRMEYDFKDILRIGHQTSGEQAKEDGSPGDTRGFGRLGLGIGLRYSHFVLRI